LDILELSSDKSENETYQKLQTLYNKTRRKLQKFSNVNQLLVEYQGLLKQKQTLERELDKSRKVKKDQTKPRVNKTENKNSIVQQLNTAISEPILPVSSANSRNKQAINFAQNRSFQPYIGQANAKMDNHTYDGS